MIGLGIRAGALALGRVVADLTTWALLGVVLPMLGAAMVALTAGFYVWFTL